jgi:hypothetical protein
LRITMLFNSAGNHFQNFRFQKKLRPGNKKTWSVNGPGFCKVNMSCY